MGMKLLGLPPELVLSTAQKLDRERDLNAFARTCRRLYSILDRELYRRNVQLCGSAALLWAAERGRVVTVRKLLAEGADVRKPRKGGEHHQCLQHNPWRESVYLENDHF